VAERRPDVQFVTYDRHLYRHWLGSRPDTAAMRNARASCIARSSALMTRKRPPSKTCGVPSHCPTAVFPKQNGEPAVSSLGLPRPLLN
jgi:hypothetical protein